MASFEITYKHSADSPSTNESMRSTHIHKATKTAAAEALEIIDDLKFDGFFIERVELVSEVREDVSDTVWFRDIIEFCKNREPINA